MNIGIDIRSLMNKNYSGVAEYTYNLLDNLFKLDSYNKYYLFYNSKQNITENLPQFNYHHVKFKGYQYPNKLFNLSLKLFKYPKLDKLITNLDHFFIPNFNFSAFSKNFPITCTVHDLSFELFPEFFSTKRQLWHKIIKPTHILKSVKTIIADSHNTKNDLINLYQIKEDKIKVIYPGIDHNLYRKIEANDVKNKLIKEQYQLPDNFIFYLGTIEPRKNITGLIKSFNLIKKNNKYSDLHLVIAGEKGWKYKQVFETAEKSPYTDQIKFIGYVKRQDKAYLYNLAEVFVFPSFYEGFGLPVLEAQACGTPVVSGLNSSLPEILNDTCLLIKPDNINEISQSVLKILNSPKLKQDLITKGLINSKNYSWLQTARQTLGILTN